MSDIYNSSNNTVVQGTASDDVLFSSGVNVEIYGDAGDDKIENRGYNVTIDAGAGKDFIYSDVYTSYGSRNYQSATIYAGSGDDTIRVNDHRTFLDGGADNDFISINGGNHWQGHTLKGGTGNDTIYGGKQNTFLYSEGDGNDIFYNVGNGDKISIETNKAYSTVQSGYDIIITVGDGSMTLKNGAGKAFEILKVDKTEDNEFNFVIGTLNKMTDNEFTDFIETITNAAKEFTDNEVAGVINSTITYFRDLRATFAPDEDDDSTIQAKLLKLSSSSIAEFASIYETLDKFSTATDTAIWGAATENNIKILTLAADILSTRSALATADDKLQNEGIKAAILSYVDYAKELGNVAKSSFDLIKPGTEKLGPFNAMNFYVSLWNSAWGIFEQSYKSHQRYYADGKWDLNDTSRFLMDVSMAGIYGIAHTLSADLDNLLDDWILGDDGDSNLSYPERLSLKLSNICENIGNAIHKFGSNIKNGLLNLWNQLQSFQYSFNINLVLTSSSIIRKILSNSLNKNVTYLTETGDITSSSKNAVASITITNNKSTFKALKNVSQTLSLGSEKDTMEWIINTTNKNDNITVASIKNVTVKSGDGDDIITINGKGSAYINADKGNDKIYGGTNNDSLNGGAGNDTINGGEGNDYINGGAGNDMLYGDADNDNIYGGADNDYINGGAGHDSLFGDAGNDTIYGGSGNDYIEGGSATDRLYGDAGNDTLIGGKGNDTLTGGNGKDIITDYTAGQDTIKISAGKITKTTYNGDDIIFKIGNGTLTVQNGKDKNITISDANNKTTTQTYSGRAAETEYSMWFTDDDNNYVNNDIKINDISKISATNYSMTEIQSMNYKTLAQDKPIITYAK